MRNPVFGVGASSLLLRMLTAARSMGSGSAQHAQLQRFPANLLPKCVWLSLFTRWQVQGPWPSSVPWLIALKLICPLSC